MSALIPAAAAAAPLAGWSLHALWMRRQLDTARRDPLTGLHTRAVFEKRAARLLAGGPCAVLLVDLDRFKAVNDTYGHAAGDQAIRSAGTWLTEWLENFSYTGCAARLGGDEFAAVIRVPDPAALRENLRTLHQWMTIPFRFEERDIRVGASIGVFLHPGGPAPHLPTALRRADEAMYAAKFSRASLFVTEHADRPLCGTVNGRRAGRDGTHHTEGRAA